MIYTYCYSISNMVKATQVGFCQIISCRHQHYVAIILAVLLYLPSFQVQAQCPTNLIHHYTFDEKTAGTYADYVSPVTANCTECPSPTSSLFAGAQKFDGRNDGVVISDNERFEWENNVDFTIELWVQVTGNAGKNQVIMGRVATDSKMSWWVGVDPEGYAVFELYDKNRTGFKTEKMGKKINDGKWHHIVVMRNGGLLKNKLYIDGYKVADFFYDKYTTDFKTVAPVTIGYYKLDNGYHFAGAIDEVMLYNKALNETEVRSRYNYGSAAYCGPENLPPVVMSEPVTFGVAAQPYTYDVQAIGVPAPVYSLVNSPQGMRINATTGEIEWAPATAGKFNVTVNVENSLGKVQQSFSISVKPSITELRGLRHHWMLHEVTGTQYKDYYTPYNASSTAEAKPEPIPGVISGGQRFDGVKTGLNVENSSNFNWLPDESFSIELWMRTTASTAGNKVLIGRDGRDSDLHWWIGADSEGHASFQLKDYLWDGIGIGGGPKLTDGVWHHIVAVRDGASGANRLFVDGVQVAQGSFTYKNGFQSITPVNIGYLDREGRYRFEGDMDEVMLYGRALTAEEIKKRYQTVFDGIVELISFEGRFEGGAVVLDWETQTEVGLSHFIVERSADGTEFTEIGTVQANGTSSERLAYSLTDPSPIKERGYYRLRIVKENGAFTYSHVVIIEFGGTIASSFFLYPNPVQSGDVNVNITNMVPDERVVYMLSSITGKKITTQEIQVAADGTLDFIVPIPEQLRAGIYVLSVISEAKTISRKIVVLD